MQTAYLTALYDLMAADSRVCSLLSDSGTEYDKILARSFPDRCYNFGIAEALQVAAASGMAAMGKIPFVYTTGAFLAYRACEFIRDDICLPRRNVKIVGIGMGMGMGRWSTLGPSHHTTEDIAVLRAMPNLTLLSASTPRQLAAMVPVAAQMEGPVYLRMGMAGEAECYPEEYTFTPGAPEPLLPGADYALFSTGTILEEVRPAVLSLRERGMDIALWDVHTLKPFPQEAVAAAVAGKKAVFTVEEHNTIGGLGTAVAEALAQARVAVPFYPMGLPDRFGQGYGTIQEVRRANGLDADSIARQIAHQIQLFI